MTEPTKAETTETVAENQPSAVATQTEPTTIPYDRFKAVNDKAKELEARLAELDALEAKRKAEAEKAENDRLAKQQEWQTLAEKKATEAAEKQAQLDAMAEYKAKWEGVLNATTERNKVRIEAIEEDKRSLVPEYDDPMKLAEWLDINEKQLTTEQKVRLGNGSPRAGSISNNKMPAQPTVPVAPVVRF